jgi:CheY-like chemotaxis protein/HPt (histidine-containing phosphotransfer) domain-containing protein
MDTLLAVRGAGQEDCSGRLVTKEVEMAQRTERPRDTSPAGAIAARILLAEDNPVNQQVAAAIIQRLGVRVDVAGNGKEVLELLDLLPYDLVFMDCEMPEVDGYAATAEIRRRNVGGRRVPIVAMTAHAMQGDREQCLAAGMDDYVTKPVNPATIEAVIRRWVHATQDQEASHASIGAGAIHASVDRSTLLDATRTAQLRATLGHGDGSLLRKVVEGFLRAAHDRIGPLRTAIEEGDAPAVRRIAHTLRGSALNLGAVRITAVASALERMDATAGHIEAHALVDDLQTEIERVEPALLRLLQPEAPTAP